MSAIPSPDLTQDDFQQGYDFKYKQEGLKMTEVKHVYTAINNVVADIGKIGVSKSKTANTGGGGSYKFRGIDDIYGAISPLLAKHNLVILPRFVGRQCDERTSNNGKVIFYTVVHAEFDLVSAIDGSIHKVTTFGEAMDSGDKSTNKAMSAAYKYACFLTFCIPVEGQDSEQDTYEVQAVDIDVEAHKALDKLSGLTLKTQVRDLYKSLHPSVQAEVVSKFTAYSNGLDQAKLNEALTQATEAVTIKEKK